MSEGCDIDDLRLQASEIEGFAIDGDLLRGGAFTLGDGVVAAHDDKIGVFLRGRIRVDLGIGLQMLID
jgi:hypothetical protein